MTKFPLYFNCHFFKSLGAQAVYTYKIDHSSVDAHPFQLFRRTAGGWENLSVYASLSDAVRTLLKELLSAELSDEISHGQATINPREIMDKIHHGETTISIGGHQNDSFRIQLDVTFEDMVER